MIDNIDELIKELQEIRSKYGNIEVAVYVPRDDGIASSFKNPEDWGCLDITVLPADAENSKYKAVVI